MQRSVKYININSLEFEEFTNNELYLTFSIFALSQLGEFAAKVSEEMKAEFNEIPWQDYITAYPEIPWFKIKGLRNRIVHDYEGALRIPAYLGSYAIFVSWKLMHFCVF